MTDLKLAVRTLLRARFITAVADVSLAVGIGANASALPSIGPESSIFTLRLDQVRQGERLTGPKPAHQ